MLPAKSPDSYLTRRWRTASVICARRSVSVANGYRTPGWPRPCCLRLLTSLTASRNCSGDRGRSRVECGQWRCGDQGVPGTLLEPAPSAVGRRGRPRAAPRSPVSGNRRERALLHVARAGRPPSTRVRVPQLGSGPVVGVEAHEIRQASPSLGDDEAAAPSKRRDWPRCIRDDGVWQPVYHHGPAVAGSRRWR
jgi:hypothetical protein